MPELLLELFSEEIPARMQARAAADLGRLLGERLTEAGLAPSRLRAFAGPRRLTAVAEGVAARSADVVEERKGPRVGAPDKALEGFVRAAGLASLADCETKDDGKGAYYVARISKPGRPAGVLIAAMIPEIAAGFPWPKSMRWGAGSFRWVRPLHRVVCLFDGAVVPFAIGPIASGNVTEGHRLMGRGPFEVRDFASYRAALEEEGRVLLEAGARALAVEARAQALCEARGLALVADPGLLEEVAGLVEWPAVLLGDMDPAFLDLPPEVIRLTMRTHQKYFAVRDARTGALAPHFVVVANQEADDGGAAIAAGNGRVLSARLNDARYFWDLDRKTRLDSRLTKLKDIVFHQKLGSMADKAARVAGLARALAPVVGADPDLAERAARLCKADLVTEMVGEFPELQGVMGRYYALLEAGLAASPGAKESREQGAARAVADAIRDHYKPMGPSDGIPSEPVGIAVALADKLDTLAGFWAIGEKPSGSGDPYALRRAALGVVRLVLSNAIRLPLARVTAGHGALLVAALTERAQHAEGAARPSGEPRRENDYSFNADDLLAFFADRLKVHLRDEGKRHDLIDAVFALGEDDLVLIVKRVEALSAFLASEDGAHLHAAYKRAANIVRIEEKRDERDYDDAPDAAAFVAPEEKALHAALTRARESVNAAVQQEDFGAAMAALAALRPAVNAFFDQVKVNAEDDALRRNRLLLLSQIRDALGLVADFSKIAG